MEKQKVKELLDKAANDYASENIQHDLSAQYSAFIAGANYASLEVLRKLLTSDPNNSKKIAIEFAEWCDDNNYIKSLGNSWIDSHCDIVFKDSETAFSSFLRRRMIGKKFKAITKEFVGILIGMKGVLHFEDSFLIKNDSGIGEWFNGNELELCGQD
jgi:hypothetical protein